MSLAETGLRLSWTDQLRLEFALFRGRQLFSWPGAQKFEYQSLDDLAGGGPSTSGEFGPFAISVFLSDADPTAFRFVGMHEYSGKSLAEYKYKVPLDSSHFAIQMGRDQAVPTAFEGSFLIDLEETELRRLVVEILEPPLDSGVTKGRITIEYGSEQIGGTAVILPREAELRLLSDTGNLAVNETTYTGCKQFSTESSIRFADSPAPGVGSADSVPGKAKAHLAPGLTIVTRISTTIDSRTSFTGDPVEAVVTEPVKDGNTTVVPTGARLVGRIVRLERRFHPARGVILGIQFDHLDFEGRFIYLSLRSLGAARSATVNSHPSDGTPVPPPVENDSEHVAVIQTFGSDRFRLDSRTMWRWETL